MPDTYFVRITPRALADLEQIFEYIRQDSPQNAATMIEKLVESIAGLNILPHRYDVPRVGRSAGGRSDRCRCGRTLFGTALTRSERPFSFSTSVTARAAAREAFERNFDLLPAGSEHDRRDV